MLYPPVTAVSTGEIGFSDLEGFLEESGLDISPVTDNSPFFCRLREGIPRSVSQVFWSAIIMTLVAVVLPPLYLRKKPAESRGHRGDNRNFNRNQLRFVALFLMLGLGFMLAEISLIQRLVLFLGQPVLSLAVLLFSLLVGTGIGSIYSGRLAAERISKGIAVVSISIVVMLVSYTFLLPLIFNQLLGVSLAIRLHQD